MRIFFYDPMTFRTDLKVIGSDTGSAPVEHLHNRQPMENLPDRSDVRVLSGVGNDSSQTILNTLELTKILLMSDSL